MANNSTHLRDTKRAYFGSRVEVFQRNVDHSSDYYDINSSFPHARMKRGERIVIALTALIGGALFLIASIAVMAWWQP